jgi:hypothetical protein
MELQGRGRIDTGEGDFMPAFFSVEVTDAPEGRATGWGEQAANEVVDMHTSGTTQLLM